MKELIMNLAGAFGPSGDEGPVRDYISGIISEKIDELKTDAMGNLIAFKKGSGKGKKIMFAAHMDSIGLIVTKIEDNGYLRFSNIGGVAAATVANQKMMFKNGIIGVVACEAKESASTCTMNKMYIDIGASSKQEAEEMVQVGDTCAYYSPSAELAGELITSPYMDNRVSCAVMVKAIMEQEACEHDVYYVFTVQEEVGLRGAKTAAFAIKPDIGIALDVTHTGDDINSKMHMAVKLGDGPAVKIKDSSVICHPMVKDMIIRAAQKAELPYQLEVLDGGGTDTASIQMAGEGIPAGCISIPSRYIHSMSETISVSDAENAVILLKNIIAGKAELI